MSVAEFNRSVGEIASAPAWVCFAVNDHAMTASFGQFVRRQLPRRGASFARDVVLAISLEESGYRAGPIGEPIWHQISYDFKRHSRKGLYIPLKPRLRSASVTQSLARRFQVSRQNRSSPARNDPPLSRPSLLIVPFAQVRSS